MSAITVARKETVRGDESKWRSGYMTTTEVAKLCGVSRFTIINWTKQGRIKATRTAGRHYRILASEALSLLRTFDEECGNCLTGNQKNTQARAKEKNVLYAFGYGIGRGARVLKGRSKVK